ncbi:MAG: hypothetical protein JWQ25_426 [Daejeonella sp.]|nr:hypothetical protein [Daejeonella sp.]
MKVELSHADDKKPKKTIKVESIDDLLKICKLFDRDVIISLPMQGTKSNFDFYVMVYDDKIE